MDLPLNALAEAAEELEEEEDDEDAPAAKKNKAGAPRLTSEQTRLAKALHTLYPNRRVPDAAVAQLAGSAAFASCAKSKICSLERLTSWFEFCHTRDYGAKSEGVAGRKVRRSARDVAR
jgi:hypothetical protein